MSQAPLIDTSERCPLGCAGPSRRSARGWVCCQCGLEWSTLGTRKERAEPRQARPPMDRTPTTTPATGGPSHAR